MIVTLTPNPSLDRTFEVDQLVRGTTVRAAATHTDPGGKGINVARALVAQGHAVTAIAPIGSHDGEQFADLLTAEGIQLCAVSVSASVRTNVSIVEPNGTVTKINAAGAEFVAGADLIAATKRMAEGANWVVLCGSIPPGIPEDFYASVIGALRPGVNLAVDSSDAWLAAAIAARPDLIKPNRDELAQVSGCKLETIGDVVEAARSLLDAGVGAVLASLGGDGAVLVDAEGALHGFTPVEVVRSAVGAGDALLAGFLTAADRIEGLRTGLSWARAACALPNSRMPRAGEVDRSSVVVHERPDLDRLLSGDAARVAAGTHAR